jgi:polysaccharide deacetylase 2 family uncharacterized protein YibQ
MEFLIAIFIEKPKAIKEAERSGQKAIFNIIDRKIISPVLNSSVVEGGKVVKEPNKESKAINKSFLQENEKPKIVILIKNLGMSSSSTSAVMELPSKFSLGFSPYAINLESVMGQAQSKNFDTLLNLPMEPINYPADDVGPKGLMTDLPLAENLRRLNSIITIAGNHAIYSDEDERFTRSVEGVKNLVKVVATLKKKFLYGLGINNNLFLQAVEANSFPVLIRDLTIDDEISSEAIDYNLQQLELIAKKKGLAIGYANAYPLTLNKLKDWYLTLESKKIELIKVSELKDISADKYKQINEAD